MKCRNCGHDHAAHAASGQSACLEVQASDEQRGVTLCACRLCWCESCATDARWVHYTEQLAKAPATSTGAAHEGGVA